MSYPTSDALAVALPQSVAPLSEENRAELAGFLVTVANSTLKVKILRLFLSDSGLCLSSSALADRVGDSVFDTRRAIQQLADSNALNYCPHFAFTDLCHLSLPRLPQPVQRQLRLLIAALRLQPQWVWDYLASEEEGEE